MKQKHMIVKTILITVNTLFAVFLFFTYPSFSKMHQKQTSYAVTVLQESSALDTNQLARYRYIEASRLGANVPDPMTVLKEDFGMTICNVFIIPALCLVLANVILMSICWKRRPADNETSN